MMISTGTMKYFVSCLALHNKAIKVLKGIMQESRIFAPVLIHRVGTVAEFSRVLHKSELIGRSLGIFVYLN